MLPGLEYFLKIHGGVRSLLVMFLPTDSAIHAFALQMQIQGLFGRKDGRMRRELRVAGERADQQPVRDRREMLSQVDRAAVEVIEGQPPGLLEFPRLAKSGRHGPGASSRWRT